MLSEEISCWILVREHYDILTSAPAIACSPASQSWWRRQPTFRATFLVGDRGNNKDLVLREWWRVSWPVWWLPEGLAQRRAFVSPASELPQGQSSLLGRICPILCWPIHQPTITTWTRENTRGKRQTDQKCVKEDGGEGGTGRNQSYAKLLHTPGDLEGHAHAQAWMHSRKRL